MFDLAMHTFSLEISWPRLWLTLLALPVVALLYMLKQRAISPTLSVSNAQRFKFAHTSLKAKLHNLPHICMGVALAFFLLAFIDPRLYKKRPTKALPSHLSVEGIALYLVLDQSGSMKEKVDVIMPDGRPQIISKIDLLKTVTKLFIQGDPTLGLSGRPNDLIGLVEFARAAHVVVPLTLDHEMVLTKLAKFEAVKERAQDGTAIGYGIFKTANLIVATRNYAADLIGKGRPAYEIKSSVILLVTDGLQDPNPLDKGKRWRQISPIEAAQYAKDNHIRLYIVNVEPSLATAQFEANLKQMKQAAEITGGQFFMVDKGQSLFKIYQAINQLEHSEIPLSEQLKSEVTESISKEQLPNLYFAYDLYPYLISFGLLALLLAIVLETTWLKTFP